MDSGQVWFIYQDVNGQYSVAKQPTGGTQVAGPFTWEGAQDWMRQHGVPGW